MTDFESTVDKDKIAGGSGGTACPASAEDASPEADISPQSTAFLATTRNLYCLRG